MKKFERSAEVIAKLTPEQRRVTHNDGTERPFNNAYWDNKEPGLYVDIVSGEPLFASVHKFDSGTGWPSFTRPIDDDNVVEKLDETHGMRRIEVRSTTSLHQLSAELESAMGWLGGHLHAFDIAGETYQLPSEGDFGGRPTKDERKATVAKVLPGPGMKMRWDYDFGDGWEHDIVVEAMKQGLLINCTVGNVLRFVPPLIVNKEEIDEAIDILDGILSKI